MTTIDLTVIVNPEDNDESQGEHVELTVGETEQSGVIDVAASPGETTIAIDLSTPGLMYLRNTGSNQVKLGYNTGDYPHELPAAGVENYIISVGPAITTLYAAGVGGTGELKMRLLSKD